MKSGNMLDIDVIPAAQVLSLATSMTWRHLKNVFRPMIRSQKPRLVAGAAHYMGTVPWRHGANLGDNREDLSSMIEGHSNIA